MKLASRQLLWLISLVGAVALSQPTLGAQSPPGINEELPPTVLEEQLAPLNERLPRHETANDRLIAAAHFAQGRLLLKRQVPHQALQHFQRAWRYDPEATFIAQEVVSLASDLGRRGEAARYAVLAAERSPKDFPILRQLGVLLAGRGERDRALRMFERAAPLDAGLPRDASFVAISIEMGRLYLQSDRFDEAAERFDLVRSAYERPEDFGMDPEEQRQLVNEPDALFALMGDGFLRARQYDKALAMVLKADEFKPNEALLALRRAEIAAARENWRESRNELKTYLDAGSMEAGAAPYELLEKIASAESPDPDVALGRLLERLTQLSDQDPKNVALGYFLANRLESAGDRQAATDLYQKMLSQQPTSDGYQALMDLYLAENNVAKLLNLVRDLVEQTGGIDEVNVDALVSADGVVQKIAELALEDKSQPAGLAATLLAVKAADDEWVERLYRATLAAPGLPPYEVMEKVGLAVFMADNAERAAAIFEEAIAAGPPSDKEAALQYYLAGTLAMAEQHDRALQAAEQAAALSEAPLFQSRPAWIAYHGKRYDEAERRYLDLLKRFENSHGSNAARNVVRDARLVLSNINVIRKQIPKAEEWLELVLDEFPEDVGALNDLGYLWADQGKHLERALSMVQTAVEKAPENVAYRDSLGWAYFRLGRYAEAIRELERATDTENPDGVILDHLGDAYLKSGKSAAALDTWRRASTSFESEGESELLDAVQRKINGEPDG